MARLRGIFILDEEARQMIYGPDEMREIARHVDLIAPPQTQASIADRRGLLTGVDVIFSGWGGPRLDAAFLDGAPRLTAVFYGAGSLATILTDAVWARGITVTSALAANAVPVAEYTLASILMSLKHGWRLARETRERRGFDPAARNVAPGCYRSTVGLVSLGAVARKVLELLKPFDLNVIVYDPFVSAREAEALGATPVALAELFRRSDVVSLHTPQLSETEGMITGSLLASMKRGASFINTARAAVVRQDELITVATRRPDLQFVLDVAEPEPPAADSPLYVLPNVVFTPHIAGSVGNECRRMGRYIVEELQRYVRGEPLRWAVTPEAAYRTSHRPVAPATSGPQSHDPRPQHRTAIAS